MGLSLPATTATAGQCCAASSIGGGIERHAGGAPAVADQDEPGGNLWRLEARQDPLDRFGQVGAGQVRLEARQPARGPG